MTSLVDMARYLWSLIENAGLEHMIREVGRHAFAHFVRHYFPWLVDELSEILDDLYDLIRRWVSA